jgi:hypothetical protein
MTSDPYTDEQVKEAIRRNGDGTTGYADAAWNCAQAMKAGNTSGAIDIIDAYQRRP